MTHGATTLPASRSMQWECMTRDVDGSPIFITDNSQFPTAPAGYNANERRVELIGISGSVSIWRSSRGPTVREGSSLESESPPSRSGLGRGRRSIQNETL